MTLGTLVAAVFVGGKGKRGARNILCTWRREDRESTTTKGRRVLVITWPLH